MTLRTNSNKNINLNNGNDDDNKICGRQSLRNLQWYGLGRPSPFKFIEAVFHKFYLVHS